MARKTKKQSAASGGTIASRVADTKAAHKGAGCAKRVISFKNKNGKLVEFMGSAGKSCEARGVSQSAKAKAVRSLLAKVGKDCGKKHGYFTQASGACVRAAFAKQYA